MSQFDSSMTSKQMMQQVLFNRLNKDESEEDISKMLLTTVAQDSVSGIADANLRSSTGTVHCLKDLKELGYGPGSAIVKDMSDTDTAIRKTLVQIAESIPRLLR